MSNVVRIPTAELPARLRDWRWQTSKGEMLRPHIMRTGHLHNTLVMIWHHVMPESARIRPYYRAYSFGSFYTNEYLQQAIRVMAHELANRADLTSAQRTELRKMQEFLHGTPLRVGNTKRVGKR